MARIEFDKSLNIRAMHGTLLRNRDGSRVVVRTNRRTGRMTVHLLKQQQRTTPLSVAEIAGRNNFALIARAVAQRQCNGDTRHRSIIWAEVKAALYGNENV